MLRTDKLRAVIRHGESNRTEITDSMSDITKFARAICAFANDFPARGLPGYLIVRVGDRARVRGRAGTERLLRNLAVLESDVNLAPLPAMTVQEHALPEGDVVVAEVMPADLPPVRHKGTVWIRVGASRRRASRQEEMILIERRTSSQTTFDARPCLGCTVDKLKTDQFRDTYLPMAVTEAVIQENDRTIDEQMASLRLFDLDANCATQAGALVLGKVPLLWFPGAWIQFVQWAGTAVTDEPILQKEISGDLITVLREIQPLIHFPVRVQPVSVSALRERTAVDYPLVAIRELLLNAIMHRTYESNAPVRMYWYDDRIEIQSPGGLYGAASPENFPRRPDYRNPVVSEVMATLGYVNRFGHGVLNAQAALRRNGNPEAKFKFEPDQVVATIWRVP